MEIENEIEEEEAGDEIEDQQVMLAEMRNVYKRKKCDAIGIGEEDGHFHLIVYQDLKARAFMAKLDADMVRLVKRECENWLNKNQKTLEGYG